jgi:hypothetical protein
MFLKKKTCSVTNKSRKWFQTGRYPYIGLVNLLLYIASFSIFALRCRLCFSKSLGGGVYSACNNLTIKVRNGWLKRIVSRAFISNFSIVIRIDLVPQLKIPTDVSKIALTALRCSTWNVIPFWCGPPGAWGGADPTKSCNSQRFI